MKPVGKRHGIAPVDLGGEFTAGDPSMIPQGTVRALRNYVVRPNRFAGRAPFVHEGIASVNGFAVWMDLVNEVTNTVAMRSSNTSLYIKNTNGVGYTGTPVSGLPSARPTSYTNMLGKLYMMFDTAGVPSAAAVYDGTTISTSPFNTPIVARGVAAYDDRLFFANPRITLPAISPTFTYDWTNPFGWQATNVTASVDTVSTGVLVGRLSPTSTAANGCQIYFLDNSVPPAVGILTVAASSVNQPYVWRGNFRSVNPAVQVPLTLEILLVNGRKNTTAYGAGDMIVATASDTSKYRYRCTTAGTSAGSAPTFNPTLGSTTSETGGSTVVWTNEGTDVVGSLETSLLTAGTNWATYFVTANVPPRTNQVTITTRLKFYNTGTPAMTQLAPIEMSFRDGLTDGDVSKANQGQQLTEGSFFYPFSNIETLSVTPSVNIDSLLWSEINDPKTIQAANTFPLAEIAGLGTAITVTNGRLVVFKRRGMWIFKGVADPYEPVLPELPAIRVGCIGPLALDVSRDGELYWIGEQHIYKMNIGADSQPTEIDSPGMYEEIMAKGSGWVESQSTYNLPLLAIDHVNKDVWVYTQKGKIYIYNIVTSSWSYLDTNPTGTAAEVAAMMFDPVGQRMVVSFGGNGATRFDETSDAQDSVAATNTFWDIQHDLVPKPFELFSPRYLASLKEIGLFHLCTVQNGTLSLSYSTDRGATWTTPSGYPLTSWLSSPRIVLPVLVTGPSIMVKISHIGAGGARNWSISKMDATLFVHRGEFPWVTNT